MSCPLLVAENDNEKQITIYPNPSIGIISFNLPIQYTGVVQVEITDALGQVISLGASSNMGKVEMDLSHLATGVYSLSVLAGEIRFTQRIIRE